MGFTYQKMIFPEQMTAATSQRGCQPRGVRAASFEVGFSAYCKSVMKARCFPLTSVSVCVRLRVLNLTVPEVYGFTTDRPSGVVDFRSPSSRNHPTTSLSCNCIGLGTPGSQV